MDSRAHIAADAIGSVRAEGLEPGATVAEILDRWVNGQIETEQLGEAARRLAAGAGHTLAWEHLDASALVHASRRSFQGDNRSMRELIESVLDLPGR